MRTVLVRVVVQLSVAGCLVWRLAQPALAAPESKSSDPIAGFRAMAKAEAEAKGLPAEIADAVMAVESDYDPSRIGGVGEIGLMQVRLTTAAMLGFRGSASELAEPSVNIHYGVSYLASAWEKANGDLCRALMKYRAGHGQEVMTPLSVTYCERARAHLASRASLIGSAMATLTPTKPPSPAHRRVLSATTEPFRRGAAFWAAHDARVQEISRRIEARWRKMASR